MTRYQINKAIRVVGSREKLNHMVMQVAEMWDAIFLEGLADHLKAGKSLEKFFITNDPKLLPAYANPEHLRVEKEEEGYSMEIGICVCGNAGEAMTAYFDADGDYRDDVMPNYVIY